MSKIDTDKLKVLIEMGVLPNKETFLEMISEIESLRSRLGLFDHLEYHLNEARKGMDNAVRLAGDIRKDVPE